MCLFCSPCDFITGLLSFLFFLRSLLKFHLCSLTSQTWKAFVVFVSKSSLLHFVYEIFVKGLFLWQLQRYVIRVKMVRTAKGVHTYLLLLMVISFEFIFFYPNFLLNFRKGDTLVITVAPLNMYLRKKNEFHLGLPHFHPQMLWCLTGNEFAGEFNNFGLII